MPGGDDVCVPSSYGDILELGISWSAFMSKIKWILHPAFEKEMPKDLPNRPVAIEVLINDGKKMRKKAKYLRGASLPKGFELTDEELVKKLEDKARRFLTECKISEGIKPIYDLETVNQLNEIMNWLSNPNA